MVSAHQGTNFRFRAQHEVNFTGHVDNVGLLEVTVRECSVLTRLESEGAAGFCATIMKPLFTKKL